MTILFLNPTRRIELIELFKKHENVVIAVNDKLDPSYLMNNNVYCIDSQTNIDEINKICIKEEIDLVIPWLEKDIVNIVNSNKKLVSQMMFKNSYKTLMCFDKEKVSEFLFEKNIVSAPEIYKKVEDLSFPIVKKPRNGSGSVGVEVIYNFRDLGHFNTKDFVYMKYYEGTEFSVDCFSVKGKATNFVCRERLKTRGGESLINILIKDTELIKETRNVCNILELDGVVNLQFLRNENGLHCIDINPRFSGGVIASILAGVDYPKLVIDYYIHKKKAVTNYSFKQGTISSRYHRTYIK
ncbi:ATP-grasp domain-containing protein [Staphylococcus nepalensis]|uniref:ATP-grasp domain-containing protein n=1 Tax=Staphylococcus nepalensis TaxID=214473 RepID=UPI003EE61C08